MNKVVSLFNDGKAPEALRTIGEVAKALGIRQHVLRYWEEQFPMLKPVKRSGGRRYYRPEDVALIVRINRLVHQEGYTLRGARQAISAGPENDTAEPTLAENLSETIPAPVMPAPVVMVSGIDHADLTRLVTIREILSDALKAA